MIQETDQKKIACYVTESRSREIAFLHQHLPRLSHMNMNARGRRLRAALFTARLVWPHTGRPFLVLLLVQAASQAFCTLCSFKNTRKLRDNIKTDHPKMSIVQIFGRPPTNPLLGYRVI